MEDYLEDMTEHKALLILERTRYLEDSDCDPPDDSSSETDQETALFHPKLEQEKGDAGSADPLGMSQKKIHLCPGAAVSENEGSNNTEATGFLVKEPGNESVVSVNQVNFLVKEECIDSHESWQESLKTEPTSPSYAGSEETDEINDCIENFKNEVIIEEVVPDSSDNIRTFSSDSEEHDFYKLNNQPLHIDCCASQSSWPIASSSTHPVSEMLGMDTQKHSLKISSSEHGTVLHQRFRFQIPVTVAFSSAADDTMDQEGHVEQQVADKHEGSSYANNEEIDFHKEILQSGSTNKQHLKGKQPGKALKAKEHSKKCTQTQARDQPYKCSQCGKCFINSRNLTEHMRTHTGERPYRCFQCGQSFISSTRLTEHMRTHEGGKSYKCSQCEKSFPRSGHLNKHMRKHIGGRLDRLYKCSWCGETFTSSGLLSSHMRVHTEDRPHKCSQCGHSFRDSSHLTAHMRMHTENWRYKCCQCRKSFLSSSNLTLHMQMHTTQRP